jgi:aconitase A
MPTDDALPIDDALLAGLEELGCRRGMAECCTCVGTGGFFITRLV